MTSFGAQLNACARISRWSKRRSSCPKYYFQPITDCIRHDSLVSPKNDTYCEKKWKIVKNLKNYEIYFILKILKSDRCVLLIIINEQMNFKFEFKFGLVALIAVRPSMIGSSASLIETKLWPRSRHINQNNIFGLEPQGLLE